MKNLFIILFTCVSFAAMGQSNLEKGLTIGPNGDLIDSLNIVAGKAVIGVEGSDYTLGNDSDVQTNATNVSSNSVAIDTKASNAHVDGLRDTVLINSDSIDNKIGLDETERMNYIIYETGIDDTDTISSVKINGVSRKITKGEFQYDLVVDIGNAEAEIDKLNDSITKLRTTISLLELSSDFDSLRLSTNADSIYAYWSSPTGQVIIPWVVGAPQDRTPPTYVSGEVGTYSDSVIVLTLSEFLLGDSIYDYSGAAGGNFSGLDHAYNFDETSGIILYDKVGSDHGTNTTAALLATGIAGFAYDFVAADEDRILTIGDNYGNDDWCVSVWVNPDALNFAVLGDEDNTGSMFWRIEAGGGFIVGSRNTDATSATTSLLATTGSWQHLVASHDDSDNAITFYRNGPSNNEIESYTASFSALTRYIGALGETFYSYDGEMDDMFIFLGEECLAERVDSLYNSGDGRRYNDAGGSAAISADTITEAFNATIAPLLPGFAVDSVWILGNKVYLDLTDTISYSDIVTFRYTKPTGSGSNMGVRDTSDNYMATIPFLQTVTNNIDTSESFTIYKTWDFEGESVGHWTNVEIRAYFVNYNRDYLHNTAQQSWYIVTDTINATKNLQRRHWYDANQPTSLITPEITIWLDDSYEEIYFSWDYQQGINWTATDEAKVPGPRTQIGAALGSGYGFIQALNAKKGGIHTTYHYDQTNTWIPWAVTQDTFQLNPGNSYRITQRIVCNSFTGGVANYDGIYEYFVDGKPKYQISGIRTRINEGSAYEVNAFWLATFFGPSKGSAGATCYNYFDNIQAWIPNNDITLGTHDLHGSDSIAVPNPITSEAFYYDLKITSDATDLESPGSSFAANTNYRWLIDAGEGNIVSIDFDAGTVGSNNWLIFYDGMYTSAATLEMVEGYQSNLGGLWGTSGVVTSTGRYMFVSEVSDETAADGDFTGDITFSTQ